MVLLRLSIVWQCYRYVANIYKHTHIKVNHKDVANIKWFFYPALVLEETTCGAT